MVTEEKESLKESYTPGFKLNKIRERILCQPRPRKYPENNNLFAHVMVRYSIRNIAVAGKKLSLALYQQKLP